VFSTRCILSQNKLTSVLAFSEFEVQQYKTSTSKLKTDKFMKWSIFLHKAKKSYSEVLFGRDKNAVSY